MILLTASSGLGTYIPAVQLYHYLVSRGFDTSIEVLEKLYRDDKLNQIIAARQRFQKDFRFALTAKKILNLQSPAENVCPDKSAALLDSWQQAGERHFIVFSGFWLPLLKQYREKIGQEIILDCLQMEAVLSPSWCIHLRDYPYPVRHVWFYSMTERRVVQSLLPPDADSVHTRERRLVMHGGGWQIGDYGFSIEPMLQAGYDLLVGQAADQPPGLHPDVEYFRINPSWETWTARQGEYVAIEIQKSDEFVPIDSSNRHWLLQQITNATAIVSKPGGATLLDSLSTATPLIYTAPYGETEARNADLWRALDFGVSFAEWQASGYDEEILTQLRRQLQLARASLPCYGETLHAA